MAKSNKRKGDGTIQQANLPAVFASMVKGYRIVRGLDLELQDYRHLPIEKSRQLHCEYMSQNKAHEQLFSQCLVVLGIPRGHPTIWFLELLKDGVMKIDKDLKNCERVAVQLYDKVQKSQRHWGQESAGLERDRNARLNKIKASLGINNKVN